MPAFKLFGEDGILLKITTSLRLAERLQKLNEGSTIEEWKPGEIAVKKVYMDSEGKVCRADINCENTISFEFYLTGNRRATISTKRGELIIFIDKRNIKIF